MYPVKALDTPCLNMGTIQKRKVQNKNRTIGIKTLSTMEIHVPEVNQDHQSQLTELMEAWTLSLRVFKSLSPLVISLPSPV